MLGITYKAAWFMTHRLRYATSTGPLFDLLQGTVEIDETYVGGRRKGTKRGRPNADSHKTPSWRWWSVAPAGSRRNRWRA